VEGGEGSRCAKPNRRGRSGNRGAGRDLTNHTSEGQVGNWREGDLRSAKPNCRTVEVWGGARQSKL
jgi:hypothetical protein